MIADLCSSAKYKYRAYTYVCIDRLHTNCNDDNNDNDNGNNTSTLNAPRLQSGLLQALGMHTQEIDGIYIYIGECVCVCLSVCLCVYPSDGIHVVACGPIGTKFCTHMQIHLQMVVS